MGVQMYRVELGKYAKKALGRIPKYIVANLLDWVQEVEDKGLEKVRKIPGYHDEPLLGAWKGYRSIRLSRSYRAIYFEDDGELKIITIVEVSKHEY
ncbi:type II toxin-antitoxin system RelE family toxin [Bdellovibrio bacteriovorus]|uniref:type II toxin-antitoxin system RelE family toxin n=1 Tax=Bdellovibrio bacteriovorus TaxID=959 RepID=UPI001F1FE68B|nr:type II toxin-antitoxin system mRNA interferase toxin, RelE/StbE family [Bdellovibrio bacteriovorus]